MIIDRLDRINRYAGLGANFATAARWLLETDLHGMEPGTVQIDGDRVYATLADNRLEPKTPAFEAHHLYTDIQLILKGRERFLLGWDGQEGDPPNPDSDYYPCEAEQALPFTLEENQFVVFLPGELHAPCNPDGAPSVCRKLVVKVKAE